MNYKSITKSSKNQYSACAIVGRNEVSLGWSIKHDEIPADILGFAIKKTETDALGEVKSVQYLKGQKRFKSFVGTTNLDVSSEVAPFQRFRWNDYEIKSAHTYKYEIFPIVGTPVNFVKESPLTLRVTPSPEIEDNVGIYTNRGVTSAKAYYELFGDVHPKDIHNNSAYIWLSNGFREALLKFIDQARNGDEIHISIYELHDEEIVKLLKNISQNGVKLKILYHFKDDNASHENYELVKKHGLIRKTKQRTSMSKLSHNKFVILLRNNTPIKLWTGTANFSEAGFHFQTNVGLIIEDTVVVQLYESYFQIIYKNAPQLKRGESGIDPRDEINAINDVAKLTINGKDAEILFSPIRGKHVLAKAKAMIRKARESVFISAPFGLDTSITDELNGNDDSVLEYGLISHTNYTRFMKKLTPNNNTRFFRPKKLGKYMGVRWDSKGFGSHKIHSKFIICDAFSNNPKVLIGSANFSTSSCQKNDENAIYIEGNKRLAACLTTDFMRMFDHYKSRFYIDKYFSNQSDMNYKWLAEDSKWTDIYFKQNSRSHKFREREIFSGK